jgi:hypothetical protein
MKKEIGEISGMYDLRIRLGTRLGWSEAISRAIRDCFLRNAGKLNKEVMDMTLKAVGKNNPKYKSVWREFKRIFEIRIVDGQYVNPFHPN